MIKCYKEKYKTGVDVVLEGNLITLTAEFCCIASNLLLKGAPLKILLEAVVMAEKYKGEWNDKS